MNKVVVGAITVVLILLLAPLGETVGRDAAVQGVIVLVVALVVVVEKSAILVLLLSSQT